jgi:hypothetical protein
MVVPAITTCLAPGFLAPECFALIGPAPVATFIGAACARMVLIVAGALCSSASFDAAAFLLDTVFMVLRVFWIMLGLCAEAMPTASAETSIAVFIVFAGFLFILSPYFFAGAVGFAAAAGAPGSRS